MPLATFLLLQGYWGIVKSRLSYKVCVLVEVCTGISSKTSLIRFFSDGWTTNDLIYQWKDNGPVQKTANLSLPGGFKLDGIGDKKCDVITATGS